MENHSLQSSNLQSVEYDGWNECNYVINCVTVEKKNKKQRREKNECKRTTLISDFHKFELLGFLIFSFHYLHQVTWKILKVQLPIGYHFSCHPLLTGCCFERSARCHLARPGLSPRITDVVWAALIV